MKAERANIRSTLRRAWWLAPLVLLASAAFAEPYLAVEAGLKCVNCHVNPSGGGKRNAFGTLYARNQLAARTFGGDDAMPWTGEITDWFAFGGDYRGAYESVDIPGRDDETETDTKRATVYAELRAIPELLSLYVDYRLEPGDADHREAYVLLTPQRGRYTIKAGQFFLPFGLRLEDDATFVRQTSGVSFATPDDGLELGVELGKWSVQVALTDSPRGGSNDRLSLSATYVLPRWRVGASVSSTDDPFGDRTMYAVFGGLRTGPVSWLAELDWVTDELPGGDRDRYATLLEANWRLRKGHNLKVGYEFLDPDRDRGEDQQERYSVVWEYSPVPLVQTRVGARFYNGIPNFPASNRDELFAELHFYW